MDKDFISAQTRKKLVNVAQGAARTIDRWTDFLQGELNKNTFEVPKEERKQVWEKTRRPETISLKTQDVENMLMTLAEYSTKLNWYSVSDDKRAKLTKPRDI